MTCSNWNLSLSSTFQNSTMLNLWVSLHIESTEFVSKHGNSKPWCWHTVQWPTWLNPSKCLDGADRSLAKKNSGIILFKFNGGNCDYFVTGLRNGCFSFGMIQIPYEPTRSETFEERLVNISMRKWIWLVKPKTCWFMRCSRLRIHHWNLGVGFVSMLKTRNHPRTCQKRNPNSGKQHTQHVNVVDLHCNRGRFWVGFGGWFNMVQPHFNMNSCRPDSLKLHFPHVKDLVQKALHLSFVIPEEGSFVECINPMPLWY